MYGSLNKRVNGRVNESGKEYRNVWLTEQESERVREGVQECMAH